jgi:hypothetical protein
MSNVTNDIFQSIQSALADDNKASSYGDFLKTEPGNTYLVRLLPFSKEPKKTFFHYYMNGWNSLATGQYVSALSPVTFGERDPISEIKFKYKAGTPEQRNKAEKLRWSEKWLVNVYVIDDPKNPDNNGKVKILRYGKQIHKIVVDAISGEDAEDLGRRVFDLGPEGVNLRIKVEQQGDYPTYVSSKFTLPSEIDGMTKDKQKEILGSVFDLTSVQPVKTTEELQNMVREHIICEGAPAQVDTSEVNQSTKPSEHAETNTRSEKAPDESSAASNEEEDAKMKELLDGIDLS